MILCDTNIIIELLKGNEKLISYVEKLGLDNIAISSVTLMELYFGVFNKTELQQIKKYMQGIPVLHIATNISETAVSLIEQYAKSHTLNIPDALIAATAIENNLKLLTLNVKDFKYISELKLHKMSNA